MKHQVTKSAYHHPYHLFLPIPHIFLFLQIKNNSFIPNPEMLQISFILILCRQACIYQISVFIVPLFCLRVTFIFSVTHSTSSFIELFFIQNQSPIQRFTLCIYFIIRLPKCYISTLIFSINSKSAGNHSTLSNSSFESHFAASCSFKTKSPETISAQKHSMDR